MRVSRDRSQIQSNVIDFMVASISVIGWCVCGSEKKIAGVTVNVANEK